jgi:hypothetical protein
MEEISNKKRVLNKKITPIVIFMAIVFGTYAYLYVIHDRVEEKEAQNHDYDTSTSEIEASNPSTNTTNTNNKTVATEELSVPSNWKTYKNNDYGYEVKYPNNLPLASLDRDNDKIYVSNISIGDNITVRVLSKFNLPNCNDKTLTGQVKCFYTILDQNPNSISQQTFGANTFIYADTQNKDLPAGKNKDIMAFIEKGDYIYQLEILSPDSTQEAIFKKILSVFNL